MSTHAAALERCYDIHGVGVSVAAEPAVLAVVEQRLADFACATLPAAGVRFEFRCEAPSPVPAPPADGRPVYDTPYGEIFYSEGADLLYGELAGVRLRCDAGAGVARLSCTGFDGARLYLATHPLMTIALMEILERRGRFSLHAACLARDGRGVLLAGPSGAGKSTLALALARAGLDFLSDDIVFVAHEGDAVRVLGFSDALGVTADTARRFDELQPALQAAPLAGFPKRLARIEDAFPVARPQQCEPVLLVFPDIVFDRAAGLYPLDPKDAWLRLVPDVLLTHPRSTQLHLRALSALLDQVRCHRIESGGDLARTAALVADAL